MTDSSATDETVLVEVVIDAEVVQALTALMLVSPFVTALYQEDRTEAAQVWEQVNQFIDLDAWNYATATVAGWLEAITPQVIDTEEV